MVLYKLSIINYPVPKVTTTVEGDIIIPPKVFEALKSYGANIDFRPVDIENNKTDWVQGIPNSTLELTPDSLRSERVPCSECGGITKIRISKYPPLKIKMPKEGEIPSFANIIGVPTMVVFSQGIYNVLKNDFLSFL